MRHHLHPPLLHCLAALLLVAGQAQAQEEKPVDRLLNSDPKQLLDQTQGTRTSNTITSIVDQENRDVREAPAQVQVITARQIQASGARDLYEALALVPGFNFAVGADGAPGVALHGLWAGEGRCLFLLNGQQLNENELGSYALDLRIPLATVERIEVIPGPASTIHGGYAELGVVNIVTRSAEYGTGSKAAMRTGWSNGHSTGTMVSVSGAHRLNRDQDISYLASHGSGARSNALRLLPDSSLLNFHDSTAMQANTFQFGYRWRNLEAIMLYMDQVSAASDAPYSIQQRDVLFGLKYERKLSRKFDVRAQAAHGSQLPRFYVNTVDSGLVAGNHANLRTSGRASLAYRPTKWLSFRTGTALSHLGTNGMDRSRTAHYPDSSEQAMAMNEASLIGAVALSTKLGLLTAGFRLGHNSLSGDFRAHRLSYSKVLGPVNLKLAWNTGYKQPTLAQLHALAAGQPMPEERSDSKEAELGMRLFHGFNLTLNAYTTRLHGPVARPAAEPVPPDHADQTLASSQGMDLRASFESKKLTALLGFGLSEAGTTANGSAIFPQGTNGNFPGLPPARGYLVLAYDLGPSLTIRGSGGWRDGLASLQYTGGDSLGLVAWPAELTWNAGLTIHPKRSTSLAVELDCRNLTDVRCTLASPGTSGTTPLALNGREFAAALTYRFVK